MQHPKKPWLTITDPFHASVTLRGGAGVVHFADPPQQRLKDVAKMAKANGEAREAHTEAAYLRAYIASAENVEGMPAKDAKIDDWATWLMTLPTSQSSRLNDGVAAVSGSLDAELGDEPEGN